jgi:glycosyltransferase involved in cell wall biosynthesis
LPDLKILASHPVQYHAPFFRGIIAAGLDIEVGYYHQGTAGRVAHDAEFGLDIEWDVDLLRGYPYRIFAGGLANYQRTEQIRIGPKLLSWALQNQKTPLLLVGWFVEAIWLIWLVRNLRQAPTIVMSETTPLSFAATPRPAWRVSLLRWLWQHTASGLFIGCRNRTFLRQMGIPGDRLFHAPYSIDNADFATEVNQMLPRRPELCYQYDLAPDKPVFLFCGKLIPKKRPLQLLEAFLAAGLADQAQLLYVGAGQLRPKLEQRIQAMGLKHVHLIGFLNQSQMPLAYVLGELLCLISGPTETWGIVINEALACGRPVIVSDTVGCTPDLVDRENGWVTPLDNPDKLAQTLIQAFNRRTEWTKMGAMGQKKVAGHTFGAMVSGLKSALKVMGVLASDR